MTCETVRESITASDDPLKAWLGAAAEDHLSVCGDCRRFREELAGAWRILDEAPEIDPSEGFKSRVLAAVAAAPPLERTGMFRFRNWIAAAACFAAVAVSVLVRVPVQPPVHPPEATAVTDVQDNAFLEDLERSLDRTDTGYLSDYGGWGGGFVPGEAETAPAQPAPPKANPPVKGVFRHEGA